MLGAVVGRERELAQVERVIASEAPRSLAAVLVGPAGAGKTTLWDAAVRRANEACRRVLRAQPSSAETRLSYSALCDLLAGVGDAEMGDLTEPQRHALNVALARKVPGAAQPDARTIAVGLAALLRGLATSEPPLVLAVDDIQWLDRPSASALAYALRRLGDVPVRFVACLRAEPGDRRPEILRDLAGWEVREIEVGPLTAAAIFELIRGRLGVRLPRPVLLRVQAAAAGNPWFALEIARAIRPDDLVPGMPLPLPRSLDEVTRARIEPLTRPARAVLLAAAATTIPTGRLVLHASATDRAALDEALESGVVEAIGDRLRFAHPLLASAAYALATPGMRQSVHRRLARFVHDPEEAARHLALADPRPSARVASALDAGAQRARERGAPGSEAELEEQAARVTPPGCPEARRSRLIRAARAHADAGDPTRAMALLAAELATADAEVLATLGEIEAEAVGIARATARYRQALASSPGVALQARLHTDLASAFADSFELDLARVHAREAVDASNDAGDPKVAWRALTTAAYVATITAAPDAGDLLARALELENPDDAIHVLRSARFVAAFLAMYEDRLDEARQLMGDLARRATAAGSAVAPPLVAYQSLVERRAGRFAEAVAFADDARQLALQTGREATLTLALHLRAQALAHLGDAEGARSTAALVAESAAITGQVYRLGLVDQGMLGFLALSLDDPELAMRILDPAAETLHAINPGEPSLFTFLPDAVEAAIAVGHLDRAETILRWFEEPATRLGRGWALLSAARCRAELEAARGRDALARDAFDAALAIHDTLPTTRPFERARTLFALGSFERRRHRKALAREILGTARALFEETRARLWVARTDAEIARIGGRRASATGLSAMESRVAAEAAAGRTNKEIAATLGISPKTVAWNLSKAYQKLGVTTRTELAVLLASRTGTPPA